MSSEPPTYCPNCLKEGSHHLSAGESDADVDEYRCENDRCRVAYYEVEAEDAGVWRDE